MTPRTSQNAIRIIKAFEGNRLTGYVDPVGIPTIGYGHTEMAGGPITYTDGVTTTKVRVGAKISQAEANRIKARDVDLFEDALEPMVKGLKLAQHEWDALVSLMFNIGPGNLRKSSVLRLLKLGDRLGAADAFLSWNKAGGRVFKGLQRRRRAERALFLGNIKTALEVAGAEPEDTVSPSNVTEVRNSSPVTASRTMAGGAAAGVGGAVVVAQEVRTALTDAKPNIEDGGMIGLALGAVILIGAALALYARWDDAGRPRPSWWPL